MLTVLRESKRLKSMGSMPRQVFICIYSLIIHLEISIQNISLVLSCESHPKCKLNAIDNCIKRTLHKVNNPCKGKYKHHCFPPGGNNTSPSLMFFTQARHRGAEPTIKHNAPSW